MPFLTDTLRRNDCLTREDEAPRLLKDRIHGEAQNLQMSIKGRIQLFSSGAKVCCHLLGPKVLFGGRSALSPTAGVILKQTEGNFQRPLAVLDLFAQLHKVGVTVITEPEPTVQLISFPRGFPFELFHLTD